MRQEKLEELKGYIEELKLVKVLSEENVDKGFISMIQKKCLLNNGHIIIRDQILKNSKNGNAATVLPITKDNNILLVVQPRILTEKTVTVELPAGYIDDNEEAINAAKRELEEETGYVSDKYINLINYYQDQGCSKAKIHSFLALNCKKVKSQNLDPDEYIKYFECSYDEAFELIDRGYICDANSILALEMSKKYIRR